MNDDFTAAELFDRPRRLPDMDAMKRFARLVGVDEAKERLTKLLGVLINHDGPRTWARQHHKDARVILDYLERRPPLVILAGDVGTGKTELAETVGDPVARQERLAITLYPLSLATRGTGKVGEMTRMISAAFDEVVEAVKKLKREDEKAKGAVILLVDEADAVTQSRETSQMHHEDRAGVNAFIRGVDRLAEQKLPAAVILCTNRLTSIDPAVQRRAAEIFEFSRPNEAQRRAVIEEPLSEIGFTRSQIDKIVEMTGPSSGGRIGFTYSDLTQRLLPTLVLDAYPDGPVTYKRALEIVAGTMPTAEFKNAQ